ncbi:DUF418 domain-containing protein [Flavobacteriaceae bacterium 14752]|uniref:DUF418 domain-containing protein n=1 Tax=Mesohalobacter salilacus TaxID=2491711 RepID=UPI000F635542|nr:DUF418 domain-containing protein [Flavobacteriaceae bacterium 14752]
MKTLKPISNLDRIEFLDILRGMAIFFIFTANIPFFSGLWFFEPDHPTREINLASDEALRYIHYVFVDGKFYSIFSLLFGIGCVIQYNNAISKGVSFASFFNKRMFWLLVIGLIHLFLFWAGDILTLYALLGFVLVWFVKKSDKTLLITAAILILTPILNWAFMHYTKINYYNYLFGIENSIYAYYNMPTIKFDGGMMPNFQFYLQNENILNLIKMNLGNGFGRFGMILEEGRFFKVFGIFLIGLWTGRRILNGNLLTQKPFLKKVFWIGLLIGLPFNLTRGYLQFYADKNTLNEFLHVLCYALGTVPLALSIAAGIALLCLKGNRFLKLFTSVGKTALTCYLVHTLAGIVIFYGFGFELAGKYGYTIVMLIAAMIFLGQVIISSIWLKYFRYGPMEWVWRKLVYRLS